MNNPRSGVEEIRTFQKLEMFLGQESAPQVKQEPGLSQRIEAHVC